MEDSNLEIALRRSRQSYENEQQLRQAIENSRQNNSNSRNDNNNSRNNNSRSNNTSSNNRHRRPRNDDADLEAAIIASQLEQLSLEESKKTTGYTQIVSIIDTNQGDYKL